MGSQPRHKWTPEHGWQVIDIGVQIRYDWATKKWYEVRAV